MRERALLLDLGPVATRHSFLSSHASVDYITELSHSSAASSRIRGPFLRFSVVFRINLMSLVAHRTRAAARIISRTRPYSVVVDAPSSEWVSKREAIKHHAAGTQFDLLAPKSD